MQLRSESSTDRTLNKIAELSRITALRATSMLWRVVFRGNPVQLPVVFAHVPASEALLAFQVVGALFVILVIMAVASRASR